MVRDRIIWRTKGDTTPAAAVAPIKLPGYGLRRCVFFQVLWVAQALGGGVRVW